jgi:hypothetical protein
MNELEKSLDEIKKGHYHKVGEFVLGVLTNGRLEVNGYLPYNKISEIPLDSLSNELKTLKKIPY